MKFFTNDFLLKSIGFSVLISLMIAVDANHLLGPPALEQLNYFEGTVYESWIGNKNHSLNLSATNANDKITVRFPNFCSSEIDKRISKGDVVKIGYFRASPLSDIQVWSITSNTREVLNFNKSLVNYSGVSSPIFRYVLYVSILLAVTSSVLYILNLYLGRANLERRK